MIRPCTDADLDVIESIINDAAVAYRGAIPADCWHEPYMTRAHLEKEIASGVRFSAYEIDGEVAGVMGLQDVRDVTLIRHAYVRSSHQGHGIGGKLIEWLMARATNRLLVTYWTITPRQRDTSVVLAR